MPLETLQLGPVLRPAPLTLETFHQLGIPCLKGLTSPSSPYPNPQQLPLPPSALLLQARSVHLCAPFILTNPSTQHSQPHLRRAPTVAVSPPVPGSASRTLPGLRGKELHHPLLVFHSRRRRRRAPPPALPEPDAAPPPPPLTPLPFSAGPRAGNRSRGWGRSASGSTPTSPRFELFAPPRSPPGRVRASQPAHRARARAGANAARRARGRCSQPARERGLGARRPRRAGALRVERRGAGGDLVWVGLPLLS